MPAMTEYEREIAKDLARLFKGADDWAAAQNADAAARMLIDVLAGMDTDHARQLLKGLSHYAVRSAKHGCQTERSKFFRKGP